MVDPQKPPEIFYKPPEKPPPPEQEDQPPDVKKELWREAFSWARIVVLTVVLAFAINSFVIVNARVPTGSMQDTIQINDRIVAFRLSYRFRQPARYDIIVFRGPAGNPTLYVKRIIGLPGESLIIINGHVYVNGSDEPLRYDFVKGELRGNYGVYNPETSTFDPFVVPEDHFFVLGDYRTDSVDSRHARQWGETFVPMERILGRVIFRYFPRFANLMN